jgi:L-ascorbate metabolism protein UlaG (beta-lactamase superfamily)
MNMQVTWLGHAALAIAVGGRKLLIDPYLSENPAAAAKAGDVDADFILITHGHYDHIGDTLAIARRTGAIVLSTPGVARWLAAQGAGRVQEQGIGGKTAQPFGTLQLTKAVHDGSLPDRSSGGAPAGFVIISPEGRKAYIAGDTFLFDEMAAIGEENLDLAVLPIGGKFTMDPGDALRAVELLRPQAALPYHYGTWQMIQQDPERWKRDVEASTPTRVTVLKPGENLVI